MQQEQYQFQFLFALITTIAIETVVAVTMLQILKKRLPAITFDRVIFACILSSLSTLPYLWFISPIIAVPFIIKVTVAEVVIFLFESLIYYYILNIKYKFAFFISFTANLLSVLAGLLISNPFGA